MFSNLPRAEGGRQRFGDDSKLQSFFLCILLHMLGGCSTTFEAFFALLKNVCTLVGLMVHGKHGKRRSKWLLTLFLSFSRCHFCAIPVSSKQTWLLQKSAT